MSLKNATLLYAIFAMAFTSLTACQSGYANPPFQIGQIYDVAQQKVVSYDTLLPHLLKAEVIFFGEEHYTPSHLQAAEQVLETLLAHKRKPALAMEMFSWDGQPGLHRYIDENDYSLDQLIEESNWKNNWGGEFSDYRSLVTFAKTHGLELLALNPPRPLVRLVSKQGLKEALNSQEMRAWKIGNIGTEDKEYESLIFEQIELCHPGLPQHVYRRIFEASIFRDEGMAHIITQYLKREKDNRGPLVSYTGGGHIQYQIPVPKRVTRDRPGTQALTIYLVAWDPSKQEEVRHQLENGIADFIWLTALGPKGVQARCG